jgi:hypothetical protein
MASVNLFVGLLTENAADRLVTAFVKKGYAVAPAAGDGTLVLQSDMTIGCVLGLSLTKVFTGKKSSYEQVLADFVKLADELEIAFSMIVSSDMLAGTTWQNGNMKRTPSSPEPILQNTGPYRTPGKAN